MKQNAVGALQIHSILDRESFGAEEDYLLGFMEGQRNAEFQRKLFKEALDGLIQVAVARQEYHSLAYARYLLKRMGL